MSYGVIKVTSIDESLRLNWSSAEEPAIQPGNGGRVARRWPGMRHRSKRVGSQHSSTPAELAAVVKVALQWTPCADGANDLAILIESTVAIQRLWWFQSHYFRPSTRSKTTVSFKTFRASSSLDQKCRHTLCLKGSWALWKATPWRGGWTGSESSQRRERRWRHSVSRWPKPEGGFHWVDDACKPKSYTRCPTVKKRNKAHKERMAWRIRSRKTQTEEFLERPNTAQPQLGVALLRRCV